MLYLFPKVFASSLTSVQPQCRSSLLLGNINAIYIFLYSLSRQYGLADENSLDAEKTWTIICYLPLCPPCSVQRSNLKAVFINHLAQRIVRMISVILILSILSDNISRQMLFAFSGLSWLYKIIISFEEAIISNPRSCCIRFSFQKDWAVHFFHGNFQEKEMENHEKTGFYLDCPNIALSPPKIIFSIRIAANWRNMSGDISQWMLSITACLSISLYFAADKARINIPLEHWSVMNYVLRHQLSYNQLFQTCNSFSHIQNGFAEWDPDQLFTLW